MMSQVSMPSIFLGVTPAPVRRYLGTLFKAASSRYARVVLPCCGRFSGTMVALSAGFRPEQVHTSDISLFSGLIGLLAAGRDPRELEAVVRMPEVPELEALANGTADPVDHASGVLLALKIATSKGDTTYAKMFKSDLCGDWRRHFDAVKAKLSKLVGDLRGIHYEPGDLFAVVAAAAEDERTVVYLAPPDVSGGYAKMFDAGDQVTFKQPPIANFDPKTGFGRLDEITRGARALILTLQPADDRKAERHEGAIFASLTGTRLHLLLCNRKDEALSLTKVRAATATEKAPNPRYPVWGNTKDLVRPDSRIVVTSAKSEVGLYYRDLFVHRLGVTNAEHYFLVWLDGKLFGAVGMNLMFAVTGRPYDREDGRLFAWQQFAVATSHGRYRHLNKLLNLCITCDEFLQLLKRRSRFPMGDPVGVRTACITKTPEHKGNRGVMKLVRRELRDDGMYHLTYATEWRAGTYRDQLRAWLARHVKEGSDDADPEPAAP